MSPLVRAGKRGAYFQLQRDETHHWLSDLDSISDAKSCDGGHKVVGGGVRWGQ